MPHEATVSTAAALQRFWAAEEEYISSGGQEFAPIAETLDPTVVLHQAPSLPYGGEWRGHDGFKAWLDAMGEAWEWVTAREPRIVPDGDQVIVLVTMHAKARQSQRVMAMPVCQHVTARNGRIVDWRIFYWDTAAVNRVLDPSSTAR